MPPVSVGVQIDIRLIRHGVRGVKCGKEEAGVNMTQCLLLVLPVQTAAPEIDGVGHMHHPVVQRE